VCVCIYIYIYIYVYVYMYIYIYNLDLVALREQGIEAENERLMPVEEARDTLNRLCVRFSSV
jgi:hypothetical protein